jgi:PIN domain nuclease of toxin-antitoxin system
MRVLADTHAFFWWVIDSPKLSATARALFADQDNDVLISPVLAWELATKVRLGKWPDALRVATDIAAIIKDNDFTAFAVTIEHARAAGFLPGSHRDPFDRLLAAQSQIEGIPLITADPVFRGFGTAVMW